MSRIKETYDFRGDTDEWTYDTDEGCYCLTEDAKAIIADLEAQLGYVNTLYHIMAEHMSEVKAYADGDRTNTLSDIVEHCVSELNGTDEQAKEA